MSKNVNVEYQDLLFKIRDHYHNSNGSYFSHIARELEFKEVNTMMEFINGKEGFYLCSEVDDSITEALPLSVSCQKMDIFQPKNNLEAGFIIGSLELSNVSDEHLKLKNQIRAAKKFLTDNYELTSDPNDPNKSLLKILIGPSWSPLVKKKVKQILSHKSFDPNSEFSYITSRLAGGKLNTLTFATEALRSGHHSLIKTLIDYGIEFSKTEKSPIINHFHSVSMQPDSLKESRDSALCAISILENLSVTDEELNSIEKFSEKRAIFIEAGILSELKDRILNNEWKRSKLISQPSINSPRF